jgi:hypothetical protein
MEPYESMCREKGIFFSQGDGMCTVRGALPPGRYSMAATSPPSSSPPSLCPAPAGRRFRDRAEHRAESAGYIEMTLRLWRGSGSRCRMTAKEAVFGARRPALLPSRGHGGGRLLPAAFFCAANGLGNSVEILNLNPHSPQGDRMVLDYAARLSRRAKSCWTFPSVPTWCPPWPFRPPCGRGSRQSCERSPPAHERKRPAGRRNLRAGRLGADIAQTSDPL